MFPYLQVLLGGKSMFNKVWLENRHFVSIAFIKLIVFCVIRLSIQALRSHLGAENYKCNLISF